MTLIRWEPFRELDHFLARCGPTFGRLPADGTAARGRAGEAVWTPAANLTETENDYLITAELPGVRKDDVKVTVDEDLITISGERRNEREHKDEKQHRIECSYGSFARSFRLPEDADLAAISAESSNGMLKVRVPKKPAARARTIEVQVN